MTAGNYTVIVNDDHCSDTLTVVVGTINEFSYSAMILTGADNTTFPTGMSPTGYYFDFPTGTDTFDFSFDHSYIEAGFSLDSNWMGSGRIQYSMADNNPASDIQHSYGDKITEYSDFEQGFKINESGRIYDVYGRGYFSIKAGTTENHSWTMTYDFTNLVNGYLPAGTMIGIVDIDGIAVSNEYLLLNATLQSGGTSQWLAQPPHDKGYNPGQPPHGEATYISATTSYYFNGPNASNTTIAYLTSENITNLALTLTQGFAGSSFGLKFAAPIHPTTYSVASTHPNCTGNNGTITVTPDLTGVSYSIDNGSTYQTSGNFTSLAGGNYNVVIRNDSTGCLINYASNPVVLTDPPCIEICDNNIDDDEDGLIDCDDPDCYQGLNVSVNTTSGQICLPGSVDLTASATGGTSPYTYTWDNGLGNDSTHTVSPVTTTKYKVTVSDLNGCTNIDSTTINVYNPPTPSVSQDTAISCLIVGVQITASGGTTYAWSPTTGLSNPNIANPVADPPSSTTYIVTVTDGNSCTATDVVFVEVHSNAGNANAGPDIDICAGDSTTLNASGGISYTWTPTAGLSSSTIASPKAGPAATTSYVVAAADVYGCIDLDTVVVTVNSNPTANIIQDTVILCLGASTNLTATGGSTYGWTPTTGLDNANISNPVATPLTTTLYTLQVTDGNGCTDTDQVFIQVNSNAGNANAGPDVSICNGGSTPLSASGGVLYNWSPALGLSDSTVSNPTANPTSTTTYTLIATDANGCTDVDAVTVSVNTLPTADAGTDKVICVGQSVTIAASGGVNYAWSPATGLTDTTVSNPVANPTNTTTYTVTVTDGNGCTDTDDVQVTVNSLPIVSVAADTVLYCEGSPAVNISASGGTTYVWSPAAGLSNTNTSNPNANPGSSTTYVVTVTDGNGCTATDDVFVEVKSNVGNANAGPDVAICAGENTILNGSGGVTFSWSPSTGLSSTSIASPTANPSATITYTLIATDADGCTDLDQVMVTVNALPPASANADTTICQGQQVNLSSNGGINYSWSPSTGLTATNISNPVATPMSSTVYTVTVTDGNGCTDTEQVSITVNSLPIVTISPADTVILCASTGGVQISAMGGSTYAWSPTTGLSNPNIPNPVADPPATTIYIVTVTDGNGCTATEDV